VTTTLDIKTEKRSFFKNPRLSRCSYLFRDYLSKLVAHEICSRRDNDDGAGRQHSISTPLDVRRPVRVLDPLPRSVRYFRVKRIAEWESQRELKQDVPPPYFPPQSTTSTTVNGLDSRIVCVH